MDLVAEAPTLRHPTVVACAPDGRVFVAEDPMDIITSADKQLGRILCFHPDGHRTVFAENLYAVFGLQYLEGKVYVLHNPKFSVFEDNNGVAGKREELIESTNPNPWALDWNDHVPANFKLAMDGFFYVAVGDKGLYKARGRDGNEVNLHGGGIVRIRPDGTGLEIVCTGVRNILDVALNSEDEMFTYDNTDEHQWMGRVTHMIEGGYYGYPYDFIPQRPYTLWMMADYGPGAATAAMCYTDDVLPKEFHDDLFLADFGKRQLMRVKLKRQGATYVPVFKQDLFPDPPEDFRPVGITWGADGKSIYICDWQHRDTKENASVGRLWKMTYTGPTNKVQRPTWYVPLALGRKEDVPIKDLVKGLSNDSKAVRLTAQHALSAKGKAFEDCAVDLFHSGSRRSAIHVMWAADRIDQSAAREMASELIFIKTSPIGIRQGLRYNSLHGIGSFIFDAPDPLENLDASVRLLAAVADRRGAKAASNGFPEPRLALDVSRLLAHAPDKDMFVRYSISHALNSIGRRNPTKWAQIAQGLKSKNERTREVARFALHKTYDTNLLEALALALNENTAPSRTSSLRLIAELHHKYPEWKGEWWAYHPALAPPPRKTVEWEGTPKVLEILTKHLDAEPELAAIAVEGLGEANHTASAPKIRALLLSSYQKTSQNSKNPNSDNTRTTIPPRPFGRGEGRGEGSPAPGPQDNLKLACLRALTLLKDRDSAPAISTVLSTEKNDELLLAAIDAAREFQSSEPLKNLATTRAGKIQFAALSALSSVGGPDAEQTLKTLLSSSNLETRRAALQLAGKFKSLRPQLTAAANSSDTHTDALLALAEKPDLESLDLYLTALAEKNISTRDAAHRAIKSLQKPALPVIESKIDSLTPDQIAQLRTIYKDSAPNSKLFTTTTKTLELTDYITFAKTHDGDAKRGRAIFSNAQGVACIKCHRVGNEGGQIGPDLSTAGKQFPRETLIESVVYPSKVIREGYQQTTLETKDDDVITGLNKGETPDEVRILNSEGQLIAVPKSKIRGTNVSQLSMMPEGLPFALTPEEFTDLIAYLQSLK